MSNNRTGQEPKVRSRPLPYATHTVGVEIGLKGAEHATKKGAEYLYSQPYKLYPSGTIRPQPFRWGLQRFLGRGGRFLGTKVVGIPIIGPLIDLFTSSDTIMSDSEEKRLLREAKARMTQTQAAIPKQISRPIDPFSKKPSRSVLEVKPQMPLDPKYHWVFPPEKITRSRPGFDINKLQQPPLSKQAQQEIMRKGIYVPGVWGTEVGRSRPGFDINKLQQPPLSKHLEREIMQKGVYVPGVWGMEITRSRPTPNPLREMSRGLG